MATLGERAEDLQETFTGRISRRLSLLLVLSFVVVLLIGGVSILAARSIYLSTQEIDRQGQHVEAINGIHAAVHHLVSAVHESVITGTPYPDDKREKFVADLHVFSGEYEELEKHEGPFPEQAKELKIWGEMKKMISDLVPLSEGSFYAVAQGRAIDSRDLERLTAINTMLPLYAREMTDIHQIKVKRSIQQSWDRLWLILGLYLTFFVIGCAFILGSNLLVYKTMVLPIRRLASATQEVASGDFSKRVSVTARDEIGQLAHSFNVMTERLEGHEKTLQTLATLKERERIAREMHDGLAQALGYIHMHLGALEARTSAEAQGEIRGELREIKKVAGEAYEEIRQSIFGLRTMVSRGLGLIPTLTEYLHEFSRQNGITTHLQVGGDHAPRFSPDVEIQLVRIIQEALTNVRKHAGATRVVVRFDVEGDCCCVTVCDDGQGFEPGKIPEEGCRQFGLQAMRERAQGIGANLEIEATPGRGTKVMVRLPR